MSLESGKKSAAEMRAAQREMISKAESVQPTVAVMEPNWKAMIDSQKAQVDTLGKILEKLGTLTTEERFLAQLEMQLQVLRADGKIIGFTVGEMCNGDTFNVHFEKAEISIQGAYPMVCREFAKMLMARHPGLVYINREDDMGIEALRQSKMSYRPEFLLRKFTARWTNECI